ncbi:MAG: YbhB/YbcL family Raf kinase inhibitor-like protein [Anaerolineales bacterium]|nr:YbhB/YbcL family Raf kinase inhibitor-like protein [Anaerolineales bacterium]
MKAKIFSILMIVSLLLAGCSTKPGDPPTPPSNDSTVDISTADAVTSSNGTFSLSSSDVTEGGALPVEYTCDGASATLPLSWSGAPTGTENFAVIMHHVPGPGDAHWYWVMYNIPVSVTSLEKNVAGIGILGNNSVNSSTVYAPPCSKGPGEKIYTYTVYALSAEPQFSVSASDVSRDVLLDAIKDITLASASLNVTYTR